MPFSLFGAVVENFDTLNLITCELSSSHHNRIFVEEDRIKSVVIPRGPILAKVDPNSGHLFVFSNHPRPPKTTMTIVTELGDVQDIEMVFSDIPSQTIYLSYPEEEIDYGELVSKNREEEISDIINAISSGKVPVGFECQKSPREKVYIGHRVYVVKSQSYVGCSEEVHVYDVFNSSYHTANISRCDFEFLNPNWILIDENQIRRGCKVQVIVGVDR